MAFELILYLDLIKYSKLFNLSRGFLTAKGGRLTTARLNVFVVIILLNCSNVHTLCANLRLNANAHSLGNSIILLKIFLK